jgi:cytosolic 5'-nucleotidase 3
MDPRLTVEEKTPYMLEWWNKANKLIIDQKLIRDDVRQMIEDTPSNLRGGIVELITQCKEKNVPMLIFSAGVGSK